MDVMDIAVAAIQVIGKLIPPDKPPVTDDYEKLRNIYNEHYDKRLATYDKYYGKAEPQSSQAVIWQSPTAVEQPISIAEEEPEETAEETSEETKTSTKVATSCIACSRSHMATIAGALDESMRFARDGGIRDPEVLLRIDAAEKEINIMERIDLSPEAIRNSPPKDQQMAREFLPKIRKLRQDLGQVTSVEQLEKTAAEADILTHEFRLRQMELAGANLNPIVELAKKVQNGEISLEEARIQVKQYLPKGG